jgi:hypothetical protein
VRMVIIVSECPPNPNRRWVGLFEARLDGPLLCTSRQPFLTAARVMASEGHVPDTILVMRREGSVIDCLTAKLDSAAKLSIQVRQLRPRQLHHVG